VGTERPRGKNIVTKDGYGGTPNRQTPTGNPIKNLTGAVGEHGLLEISRKVREGDLPRSR